MSTRENVNRLESRIGDITIGAEVHSLSAWFVLALRLMIGYAFFHAGITKVLDPEWGASGYLLNAVPEASPLYDMFIWMGSTEWFVGVLNIAVPWGELLIGIAVLIGVFTRFAAFWGAFMMLMFYFSNWNVEHGYVNGDFAYMLVFLSVAAFGAGRIIGLDAIIEKTEFVRKHRVLRYILG